MRRSITTLILAHLAASGVAACHADDPSTVTSTRDATPSETTSATSTPAPTVTVTASAVPTPTVSATASAVPTASAMPRADAGAPDAAVKRRDAGVASIPPAYQSCAGGCPEGYECVLPFDGARVIPNQPGSCMPPGPRMGGRPLVVDGVARTSSPRSESTWHDAAADAAVDALEPDVRANWMDTLQRAALEEHASVPAFARTICHLVALGAPAPLIEKTQRALADEIVHARETFAWAEALGGRAIGPSPLGHAVAPFPTTADFLRDVVRGGCVGETLAAHDAAEKSETAPLAEMREYYKRIALDEARHAALAFETALWLVRSFPELEAVLAEERARVRELAAEDRAVVAGLIAEVLRPSSRLLQPLPATS